MARGYLWYLELRIKHHPGQASVLTVSRGLPRSLTAGPKPEGLWRVELQPEGHSQPNNLPPAWRLLSSV